MGKFLRENFDSQNIVTEDKLSIPGIITSGEGLVTAGSVIAYDKVAVKWVKYVELTHGTGLFPLGVLKEEVNATADAPAAILKMGIVNAKEVTFTPEQTALLMIQGIVRL